MARFAPSDEPVRFLTNTVLQWLVEGVSSFGGALAVAGSGTRLLLADSVSLAVFDDSAPSVGIRRHGAESIGAWGAPGHGG